MTISKKYLVVFFTIMLFGSIACNPSTAEPTQTAIPTPAPSPLLGRWIWQSATLANGTEAELYSTATFEPSITFGTGKDTNGDFDESYSSGGGNVGCNSFGFFYKLGGRGTIELPQSVSTVMLCEAERMAPEELWRELSHRITRYKIENDTLTLLTPLGARLVFVREQAVSPKTKIYHGIINSWGGGTDGTYLIVDEFAFNQEGVSLDTTRVQIENNPILLNAEPLSDELWASFEQAQLSQNTARDFLPETHPFISKAMYDAIFANGHAAGWETIQANYPQVQTIYTFSGVGSAADKTLVYYAVHTRNFNGGYISYGGTTSILWDVAEQQIQPSTPAQASITPYPEPEKLEAKKEDSSPYIEVFQYFSFIYRLAVPIPPGWEMGAGAWGESVKLIKDDYRLIIDIRNIEAEEFASERIELPHGDITLVSNEPVVYPLKSPAVQRELMIEDKRKAVLFTSVNDDSQLLTDKLGLLITLEDASADYETIDIPENIVTEAKAILQNMWIAKQYTADDRPPEPVAPNDLWSSSSITSPDGVWTATARTYQPYTLGETDQELHRATFTVASAEGPSPSWVAVDEIGNWGLGVGRYAPLAWDDNILYFTYTPSPDGGGNGVTGSALWSLDLINGQVNLIIPGDFLYADLNLSADLFVQYLPRSINGAGLLLYNLETEIILFYPLSADIATRGIAFSPNGDRLFIVSHVSPQSGNQEQTLYILDLSDESLISVFEGELPHITRINWLEDDLIELNVGNENEQRLFTPSSGELSTK